MTTHRTYRRLTLAGLLAAQLGAAWATGDRGAAPGHRADPAPTVPAPSTATATQQQQQTQQAQGGLGGSASAIGGAGGLGGSVNSAYGYTTRFLAFPASGSPPPVPAGMCTKASMVDYGIGWNFWRHATSSSETDFDCLRLVAALEPTGPRLPPLAPGEPLHPSITVAPVINLAAPCCAASAPVEPPPVVQPVKPRPKPKHHVKRHPPKPATCPECPPPIVVTPLPVGPSCPEGQHMVCKAHHRPWWKWW